MIRTLAVTSPPTRIGTLYERITEGLDRRPTPYTVLFHVWKDKGARAALDHYFQMKGDQPDAYNYHEWVLKGIGSQLLEKDSITAAVMFLEASLEEDPEAEYAWYGSYQLAKAYQEQGRTDDAIQQCEKALEGNAEFESAKTLLEELRQ